MLMLKLHTVNIFNRILKNICVYICFKFTKIFGGFTAAKPTISSASSIYKTYLILDYFAFAVIISIGLTLILQYLFSSN